MDEALAAGSPGEDSSLDDGHRASPPEDGVSPPAGSMAARVSRLLAHGFPH
jgi:hypothetical protein